MAATRGCSSERRLMSSMPSIFGIRASTEAHLGLRLGDETQRLRTVGGLAYDIDAFLDLQELPSSPGA